MQNKEKGCSHKNIFIIGNPNTGKTTLFNQLTGLKQKVGNWAGVTVDKKQGSFETTNFNCNITDLPGIYSLPYSLENNNIDHNQAIDEQIAANSLLNNEDKVDCVINIIDASNLSRNLYLTTQLLDLNIPVIVVVNMMDIAKKSGHIINCKVLEASLKCKVVPMSARKKHGIKDFTKALDNLLAQKPKSKTSYHWQIPAPTIAPITRVLNNYNYQKSSKLKPKSAYWQSLCALSLPNDILEEHFSPLDIKTITSTRENLSKNSKYKESIDLIIAQSRDEFITKSTKLAQKTSSKIKARVTDSLDKLFLNKYLGLPIFLLIMYLMFEFSMTFGSALQPLFDDGSKVLFISGIQQLGHALMFPPWLTAILSQGIGLGINTVLTFIPQIATLFLFLAFLEDSGYMARAAFVMDRFMQWVGLPGKAFVPLIVGFGCNVPSIMAARHLDNHRDRLLTILMAPFMTCGARLAIFAVFTSAFFPNYAGLVMFSLYLIGLVVAILTGLILKKTLLKGDNAPFIMELPIYHLPTFKILYTLTWQKLKGFVLKAGKVIIPICLLVGTLNSFQLNGKINTNSDGASNTYLSAIGKATTPLFEPIGITQNNWPATVGLITGTLAKEVVVGSLNTLYSQNQDQNKQDQQNKTNILQGLYNSWLATIDSVTSISFKQFINPLSANEADHDMSKSVMGNMAAAFGNKLSAFCYLLFVLLYVPCVSTIAATYREANKSYAWLSTIWSMGIAYILACVVFQIGSWILGDITLAHMLLFAGPAIGVFALFIYSLKLIANNKSLLGIKFGKGFGLGIAGDLKVSAVSGCASGSCGKGCC